MEIWKYVHGYEGAYQISNLGSVKSLKRESDAKHRGVRNLKEKILKPKKNSHGYLSVSLYLNGAEKVLKIHRLVAAAFIPNPENKACINHKNGIKTDNRIENLEWVTYSENALHSYKIGLQKPISWKGRKHPMLGKIGDKNPMFGKGGKRGSDHPNSKIVLDLQTGIFYDSLVEASKSKNIVYSTLAERLNGRRKNNTSLIYV